MSLPVRVTEEKGLQVLKEFREFAMKGNVVDLAVGVIIGAAFGGIVTSLVGDAEFHHHRLRAVPGHSRDEYAEAQG